MGCIFLMQNFAKFETIVFARDLLSGLVGFVEDYPLELTCEDKSLKAALGS